MREVSYDIIIKGNTIISAIRRIANTKLFGQL